MPRKRICCLPYLCAAMLVVSVSSWAENATSGTSVARGKMDMGLVFSGGSDFGILDPYIGGLGAKLGSTELLFRPSFDLFINGSTSSIAMVGGLALEYHFIEGLVSPYLGGFFNGGWKKSGDYSMEIPLSVGAIAGVEVFVFEWLSLFAEYNLAVNVNFVTYTATSQSVYDYTIDTGMGNEGKIGIVMYFLRKGRK